MPVLAVRDLKLYYEEHGRPDGEPLVLLHGFTGTGQSIWGPHLPRLGERYRLIVPDWRGHGRTDNPRGTIEHAELARDVAAMAAALELGRAHYCGHSSGGMLLPFLALEHPELVQSLTLVAATYTFDARVQGIVRAMAASVPAARQEALRSLHGEAHDPEYWRVLVDQWAESVQRPGELPSTPDHLRAIRAPTLIVHGDRDEFFPVEIPVAMYRAMRGSRLCILPGCGHAGSLLDPDLFDRLLLAFLGDNPIGG